MPSNFHHPMLRHARSATASISRIWGSGDRLSQVHFAYAMGIAFVLHMTAYGIWLLIPKTPVIDIPVRVLNVKLGDADDIPSEESGNERGNSNSADIEQAISKLVKDIQQPAANNDAAVKTFDKAVVPQKKPERQLKSKPFDMRSEGVAVAAPVQAVVEKQFVRETGEASNSPGNNGADKTEIVKRYEQQISAWIDKFKPAKIVALGQPDRVTASVRIRIDRRGNLRFMEIDKSSNYEALDRAAIDTVRRANPVPPAPADYPSGESIEFIVPIVFTK